MNALQKPTPPTTNPVAANTKKGQDAAAIDTSSDFSRAIHTLFAKHKPTTLIETGTYQGTGSTLILCQALHAAGLPAANLTSIEVNPTFHAQAKANLAAKNFHPNLLCGLSVPRNLLPTEADIRRETVENIADPNVFIDHEPAKRVHFYQKETDFPLAEDDLLGKILKNSQKNPDFLLLDSAGHMGFIEFTYATSLIIRPCFLALDDVYHIKHHQSLQRIQNDNRFNIIELSREKFGFCIARFTP